MSHSEKKEDVTPDELRLAIRDMKARSPLGPDAWSPSLLAALSRQGIEALADLIKAIEIKVAWPWQLMHVWYVFLTKSSGKIEPGEERPIELLSMLVRVWKRIRRPGPAKWCRQHGLEGHHPVHGPG